MSRGILALVLAAAALAVGLPALEAQEGPRFVPRFHDISILTHPVEDAAFEPFGLGWPHRFSEPEPHEDDEPRAPLEADFLVDLVRTIVSPEEWEREGVEIAVMNETTLFVRHTPAVQERVVNLIAVLTESLRPRVDVAVHWIRFAPESAERLRAAGLVGALEGGTPTDEQVMAILAEAAKPGNTHESGSALSTLSKRVAVRRATFVSYLQDYDVEIAQAAQIGDPIVSRGREGAEFYVRPLPVNGGRSLALQVLARTGMFRRPMPTVNLEATELGTIDLPELTGVTLSVNGTVRDGGTLASVVTSSQGEATSLGALLVTARRRAPAHTGTIAAGKLTTGIIDASFLSNRPREFAVGWSREAEEEERTRLSPKLFPLEESSPIIGPEELVEVIRMTVAPESWDVEGASILVSEPGFVWVTNTPEVLARCREAVTALADHGRRQVRLDLRVFSVAAKDLAADALAPGARSDDAILGRIARLATAREVRHVTLRSLVGRWTSCLAGTERHYVHDYDVEVAQEARISDPTIGQAFDGLVFNARPLLSPDGKEVTVRVGMRLASIDEQSIRDLRRTASAMNGILHHPREMAMRFSGTLSFPRGGCQVIDAGADPDSEDRRLLIVLCGR